VKTEKEHAADKGWLANFHYLFILAFGWPYFG
jgi:hypothetical protein